MVVVLVVVFQDLELIAQSLHLRLLLLVRVVLVVLVVRLIQMVIVVRMVVILFSI